MKLNTKNIKPADWSKSFMYKIHQTHFLVEKRIEHRLSVAKKITFSQFLILLAIDQQKNASQSNIAEFLDLTKATVSRHVNALVRGKYVSLKEDQKNRRKHVLGLTAKGATSFAAAQGVIETELKNIFEVIPAKDRSVIMKAFDNVLAKLLQQKP